MSGSSGLRRHDHTTDGQGGAISAYTSGGTDVPVADGGTGASTASGARTNLGISATNTPITDSGNYYSGAEVETALQEVGASVASLVAGGAGVTVKDEGSPLATVGTTLDFVGAGVVASGTGTTKTITIAGGGGGGSDFVSGASGTGQIIIPGSAGSPDIVPASPSGDDVEFDAALSGFTDLGTVTKDANSTVKSHLYIAGAAASGTALQGVYKASPSMPFTFSAKLTDASINPAGIGPAAGILLGEASPGKLLTLNVRASSSDLWLGTRTSRTDVGSTTEQYGAYGMPIYLRFVVHSSTDVDAYYSLGGLSWVLMAAGVNPSMTIGSIGVFVNAGSTSFAPSALFDWIRFS